MVGETSVVVSIREPTTRAGTTSPQTMGKQKTDEVDELESAGF